MKNIAKALIAAKQNFPPIYKNAINPHFKNKYATLDAILESIDKPLGDAGIVLVQPTVVRDGILFLSTQLIHAESGEAIESELIIPPQSDPQKLGSALTYYRRFSICSILAIAAEIDDDGNTAVANASKVTTGASSSYKVANKTDSALESTRTELRSLMEQLGWDSAKKADWAKSINPAPFAQWMMSDWETGVTKARIELNANLYH
jgi:hypothetical protein